MVRLCRNCNVSTRCQNRRCNAEFAASERSKNDTRYCDSCGELVWAFRPNSDKPDEWFVIADDKLVDGTKVSGDQCEGCGLSEYTVRQRSALLWEAVCEGQQWDGEVIAGCNMGHPVRQKPAMNVIF